MTTANTRIATRGLMPPLPWIVGAGAPDGTVTTVMASYFALRRLRDVPAFLVASLRLRSQFRGAPGGIGMSLRAVPLRRSFWTLSQWESEEALNEFARSPGHAAVMRRFGPAMAGSTFVTWAAPAGQRPGWDEAIERVVAARLGSAEARAKSAGV